MSQTFISSIKDITVDLANSGLYQDNISVMQGDNNTRFLRVTVLNNGSYVDLTNTYPVLRGTKKDGTTIFNKCTIDNGKIIVELTQQILMIAGIGRYEIALYAEDPNPTETIGTPPLEENVGEEDASEEENEGVTVISAFPFQINVIASSFDAKEMESTNEWTVLNDALEKLPELEDFEDFEEKVNNQIGDYTLGLSIDSPIEGDEGKFLMSDGSWQIVNSGNDIKPSEINGNIVVDGNEMTVYDDSEVQQKLITDDTDVHGTGVIETNSIREDHPIILKTTLYPYQDLHGFPYPSYQGNGHNKLNISMQTQTVNDVTFTVDSYGQIALSGTASERTTVEIGNVVSAGLTLGSWYCFSGVPISANEGGIKVSMSLTGSAIPMYAAGFLDTGSGFDCRNSGLQSYSYIQSDYVLKLIVQSGVNTDGIIIKPMAVEGFSGIQPGDYSYYSFNPYTNECPIAKSTSDYSLVIRYEDQNEEYTESIVTINNGKTGGICGFDVGLNDYDNPPYAGTVRIWESIDSYNGEDLPYGWISSREIYDPINCPNPSIGAQVAYMSDDTTSVTATDDYTDSRNMVIGPCEYYLSESNDINTPIDRAILRILYDNRTFATIEDLENLPGADVTASETNGNILVDGNEVQVYRYANDSALNEVLNGKVDAVAGKGLSTNDYTTDDKNKVNSIAVSCKPSETYNGSIPSGTGKDVVTFYVNNSEVSDIEVSGVLYFDYTLSSSVGTYDVEVYDNSTQVFEYTMNVFEVSGITTPYAYFVVNALIENAGIGNHVITIRLVSGSSVDINAAT